jgi:hypothetical protein
MHLAIVEARAPARPPDPNLIREILGELRPRYAYTHSLISALAERLEQDRAALASAAAYIVCTSLTDGGRFARPPARPQSPEQRQGRQERRQETKRQAKRLAAKVKATLLLDTVVTLLSGEEKPLRFCYGGEIEALGIAYSRIAERVGDAMVGEVLCEPEVKALFARAVNV